MFQIGSWFTYTKPEWEINLESLTDDQIDSTGISREKLHSILEKLHQYKVIK